MYVYIFHVKVCVEDVLFVLELSTMKTMYAGLWLFNNNEDVDMGCGCTKSTIQKNEIM